MLNFKTYRKLIAPKEIMNNKKANQAWKRYVKEFKMNNCRDVSECEYAPQNLTKPECEYTPKYYTIPSVISGYLGNCTTATAPIFPEKNITYGEAWNRKQEQGNNPMRVETTNSNLAVTVAGSVSDESKQREYLLKELSDVAGYSYRDPKFQQLRDLFHIDVDNTPTTAKTLIDAITSGKYKLDDKKIARLEKGTSDYDDEDYDGYGPFYGIIFDGPKPDRKGYDLAVKAYQKAIENTKRKIIVGSPAEGLQALLDLETWLPETATAH